MILSKKELNFYIAADRLITGRPINYRLKDHFKFFYSPYQILRYLRSMRIVAFYANTNRGKFSLRYRYHKIRFERLGVKLGFSIGYNSFGYGLLIPHHGTVVANAGIRAGNFCVLHTSTCIGGSDKTIGDGLYLSTGSLIMGKDIRIANNISVAANSLVNSSVLEPNVLLAGSPAVKKKSSLPWYERDGEPHRSRVRKIEELKIKMGIKTH